MTSSKKFKSENEVMLEKSVPLTGTISSRAKGADPAHYAAWLPRGLAAREAAEATAAEAAEAAEAARRLLAEAHAARRVAEEAKARRDAETAARLATRTQHALDDMARRRLTG